MSFRWMMKKKQTKNQVYKILPKTCKYFMKGKQGSTRVKEPSRHSIKNT